MKFATAVALLALSATGCASTPTHSEPKTSTFFRGAPRSWEEALARRQARHVHDPGIAPHARELTLPECAMCKGLGGNLVESSASPRIERAFEACYGCFGTGLWQHPKTLHPSMYY